MRIIHFFICFLFFVSINSTASNLYTYKGLFSSYISAPVSTKVEACQLMITDTGSANPYYAVGSGTTSGACFVMNNTTPTAYGTWARSFVQCPYGDNGTSCNPSCELPSTMVDGQCVAPEEDPCTSKAGTSRRFSKSGTAGDGYGESAGNFFAAAQSGCFDSCAANTADQKCTAKTSGAYSCRGTLYYSGASCSVSATPIPDVDATEDQSQPEPQKYSESQPCQYTTDAGGAQVCTSSTKSGTEGQTCGTFNGVTKCYSTAPTEKGTVVDTKVTTSTNPDGSSTTTKTDTATTTNCTGINSCTTSTTTNSTTTSKDGAGNTTGVEGACTGAQCADANTNPDGDGDGFGDCVGDDCAAGGGAGITTPELEEVASYGDSLGTYFDEIQNAPIVAAVTSISLPSGGNCPVYTETIEYVGTVSTATACSLATTLTTPLHYLFLAIWAFVAIRTTMTA